MNNWIIILLTLLFSAFFSGIEIAFLSANKLRIKVQNKQGMFSAKIISGFVNRPSRFICAMLVGNSIALVIYGIAIAQILEPVIRKFITSEIIIFIIQTVLATFLILVTGEFIPKILFRINPNRILNFFAVPVWVVYYLLYPLVYIIISISEFTLKKIFKVAASEEKPVFGRIDLGHIIKESASVKYINMKAEPEIRIFRNAMGFYNIKLKECMVPRTEIVALDVKESIAVLKQAFVETGFSKILIYKDDIDHIIGYTHCYELFRQPQSIESILLSISMVPETMPANVLLKMLIKERKSIAVVVDEFGGTSGIITMEDVMEEIFGEIIDEHDIVKQTEKQINDREYLLSGRLEIDYLNEKYKLNLPESEEYETLSGLIIHCHESIPEPDEQISVKPGLHGTALTGKKERFLFTIMEVSETRIELVNLKIIVKSGKKIIM